MRVVEHVAPVAQPPSTFDITGLTRPQMVQLAVILGKTRGAFGSPLEPTDKSVYSQIIDALGRASDDRMSDRARAEYGAMAQRLQASPEWDNSFLRDPIR